MWGPGATRAMEVILYHLHIGGHYVLGRSWKDMCH